MSDERGVSDEPIRICAWWDVYLHIGEFKKSKVTARPLDDLERVLGHRLHVEGWSRFEAMPEGVWQLHAYNYLDTNDLAAGFYDTLIRLQRVTKVAFISLTGFNPSAALSDDLDKETVSAIYWQPPEQIGLPRYASSGVLLFVSPVRFSRDVEHARVQKRRPVVPLLPLPTETSDYTLEHEVRLVCGNKQDLVSYHWPKFLAEYWPNGVDTVDIDARTHMGTPNIIKVRKHLRATQEHEAVAASLVHAKNMIVSFNRDGTFGLHAAPRDPSGEGIWSITLMKAGSV